eukprot:13972-Pleurochrysis_carterae.AAC.2
MENAKTMCPAVWWQTHSKHLPLLSKIAQTVLSQPAAASAAERNWSIYGHIKSKERNKLGQQTADKVIYCHEALHLREKLQSASYSQATANWDESDSDNDDLDEEASDFKKYAV